MLQGGRVGIADSLAAAILAIGRQLVNVMDGYGQEQTAQLGGLQLKEGPKSLDDRRAIEHVLPEAFPLLAARLNDLLVAPQPFVGNLLQILLKDLVRVIAP